MEETETAPNHLDWMRQRISSSGAYTIALKNEITGRDTRRYNAARLPLPIIVSWHSTNKWF
jgi:hypothetical protein